MRRRSRGSRISVRPVALQGRVEETRYRKHDDGRDYKHAGDGDLWLVETSDGQRGTLTLPHGGGAGWKRDGNTHWLTNPPATYGTARVQVRRATYNDREGFLIVGTDTRGRRVSIFTKSRSSADHIRDKVKAGGSIETADFGDRSTNPLRRRGAMTAKRKSGKRRAATRRRAKRPPPRGFKSWSTYMASIRPKPGGSMAAPKRRRRRHSKRRRRSTALANSPRRRVTRARRRYRRNPPAFSVKGVIGGVMDAGKGAVAMVVGEGATRYIRKDLLGMDDGETLSSIADVGIATAAALLAQRFVGRQAARDGAAGAYAYVLRGLAKQLGVDKITEVLGGGGGSHRFELRNGKLVKVPLGSWGKASRLAGWPANGARQPVAVRASDDDDDGAYG